MIANSPRKAFYRLYLEAVQFLGKKKKKHVGDITKSSNKNQPQEKIKKNIQGNSIMNKTDLVKAVSKDTGLSQEECKKVLDSVLNNIVKTISDNGQKTLPSFEKVGKVSLPGFGTFEKVIRKPRNCRNLHTGETIKVGEKTGVKFKVGKAFKEALN